MSRISVKRWMQYEGLDNQADLNDRLEEIVSDSICPALCAEACEVEPDGTCEHGCPSVLLALGMI